MSRTDPMPISSSPRSRPSGSSESLAPARRELDLTASDLLDIVESALLVHDESGGLVYANRAARDLLGLAETNPESWGSCAATWEVLGPDGDALPQDEHPVARVLRTRAPARDVIARNLTSSGASDRIVSVSAVPQFGDQDHLCRIVVTLTDISDERNPIRILQESKRKLERTVAGQAQLLAEARDELQQMRNGRAVVERALAERELLYSSVVSASSEGIAFHDQSGAIVAANDAAQAILGRSLEQLKERDPVSPHWQLIGPDRKPLPPELIPSEITLHTGERCRHRLLGVRRSDGDIAWLRVSTDPLRDTPEAPVRGVVATFADVTVEREAVVELERSRSQFKQVTEAIPGVLFQYLRNSGGNGGFTFVSPQALGVLGVAASAIEANADIFWRLMACDAQLSASQQMDQAAENGALWAQDFCIAGSDSDGWLRIRAVATKGASGILWNGVLLDVTEEHRLGDQLRRTQRREAMGDLAAGVAHNFNNVLAAIVPNLEECSQNVPDEIRPLIDDSLHAARAGSDLVRQLLRTNRRDALERSEPVDAVSVLREVARLCNRSFGKKFRIEVQTTVEQAVLLGPPGCLHQILLNLCINAREAMSDTPSKQMTLAVGTQTSTRKAYNDVVISVSDTGTGMSAQTLRHLGEPFHTTKPPGKGTGLGLAAVYSIVRDLKGSIQCASTPGAGATFEIRLPGVAPDAVRQATVLSTAPAHFCQERVLVVDDEPLVRRAIGRKLMRRGLRPVEMSDGVQALEFLSRETTDNISVVLLDLSMPRLSGEEVLASLAVTHPALPVIMVTGHVPDGAALSAAAAVLVKPTGDAELFRAITSAIYPGGSSDRVQARAANDR